MSLLERLGDLFSEHTVVPFVGAGFSIPSGAPAWTDVVRGLLGTVEPANRLALRDLEGDMGLPDLSETLDSLHPTGFSVSEYLLERFSNARLEPNDYHKALIALHPPTIVTTNWDTLLEDAYRSARIAVDVIYRDKDVSRYAPGRRVQIIKVHGTISDPSSIVFRKSQYEKFWETRPVLRSLLITLMATRHFFFAGYGFGDPNFRELMSTLRGWLAGLEREHYALVYGNAGPRDFFRDHGIQPVTAPGFDEKVKNFEQSTVSLFGDLKRRGGNTSITNLDRARLVNAELQRLIQLKWPRPVLRMRGALGWLSNPVPDRADPIYGSFEQDTEERRMTELVMQLLEEPGASMRCILHISALSLSGQYEPRHVVRRLEQVRALVDRYPARINVVDHVMQSQLNHMVFDDMASLLGFKNPESPGINHVNISKDRLAIAREIAQFDADYSDVMAENRVRATRLGIDTGADGWMREFLLRRLGDEIAIARASDGASTVGVSDPGARRLAEALVFAILAHAGAGQTREDGKTPYGVHLVRTVDALRANAVTGDYDVLTAAALHDIVEDCDVPVDDLVARFGSPVVDLILEVSQKPAQSFADYVKQLETISPRAKALKLADRLDNVLDLQALSPPSYGGRTPLEYLNESEQILRACDAGNTVLAKQLGLAISLGKRRSSSA